MPGPATPQSKEKHGPERNGGYTKRSQSRSDPLFGEDHATITAHQQEGSQHGCTGPLLSTRCWRATDAQNSVEYASRDQEAHSCQQKGREAFQRYAHTEVRRTPYEIEGD